MKISTKFSKLKTSYVSIISSLAPAFALLTASSNVALTGTNWLPEIRQGHAREAQPRIRIVWSCSLYLPDHLGYHDGKTYNFSLDPLSLPKSTWADLSFLTSSLVIQDLPRQGRLLKERTNFSTRRKSTRVRGPEFAPCLSASDSTRRQSHSSSTNRRG